MSTQLRLCLALVFCVLSLVWAQHANAQAWTAAQLETAPAPVTQAQEPTRRPSPAPDAVQGLINLDVVLTVLY